MERLPQLKEIYATSHGCVYQCDRKRSFFIDFAGYTTEFKFPCFIALKRLVSKIDIDSMALDPSNSSDIEVISPCGSERCYVLTLGELLEFRDLLEGAHVMLQLNSIIHERLYRALVRS